MNIFNFPRNVYAEVFEAVDKGHSEELTLSDSGDLSRLVPAGDDIYVIGTYTVLRIVPMLLVPAAVWHIRLDNGKLCFLIALND